MSRTCSVDPAQRYDGPDFEEFCIAEKRYLSAQRDRTPCLSCELSNLCQAGFDEQVQRVLAGKNPSLTDDCTLAAGDLTAERLFDGLNEPQIAFLKRHIPDLDRSGQ